MIQCLSKVLESYLKDYGWNFRSEGTGEWVTGWQGGERSYPLRISVLESWIIFQIQPFLKITTDWECWPEITHYLLRLNSNCHMVKIHIDENEQISLVLEVFSKNFEYSDFSDALGILGYYADYLYDEILDFMDKIGFQYSHALNFLT